MNPIAKALVLAGLALVALGLVWQLGGRFIPLGRLPGDVAVERGPVRFYFPIVTCIVLSLLLSLGLNLWRRFFGP